MNALGTRFILAGLFSFLSAGLTAGQEDPAKQKAIEQMRQVAKAIKQCPEAELSQDVFPSGNKCYTSKAIAGPPSNVEWDLMSAKTARSPFQAFVEFSLPSERQIIPAVVADKKAQKECDRSGAMGAAQMMAWAEQKELLGLGDLPEVPKWREAHYRFEFDVGSDTPELVKMLWVAKDQDNKTVTEALTDHAACWVRAARSIGTVKSGYVDTLSEKRLLNARQRQD